MRKAGKSQIPKLEINFLFIYINEKVWTQTIIILFKREKFL